MKKTAKSSMKPSYWEEFGVFGNKWEKGLIDRWYILIFGPYVIIKLLRWTSLNGIAGELCSSRYLNYISKGNSSSLDWVFLSTAILLSICLSLFLHWQNKVPAIFDELLPEKAMGDKRRTALEYKKFKLEYQSSLRDGKRYILIGLLTAITVAAVSIQYVSGFINEMPFLFFPCQKVLNVLGMIWVFFPAIWVYLFSGGIWSIITTIKYIKLFVDRFDIEVEPFHLDRAGGLKAIGEFCLSMVFPLVLGTLFCGLLVYAFLYFYDFDIVYALNRDPVFLGATIWFIIAIPLTFITFISPMLNMHREMARQKKVYEDKFSDEVDALEEKARTLIRKGKLDDAKKTKEAADLLLAMKPESYPTWPFARITLVKFISTQIPSLVLFVTSVVELGSKAKSLLGDSSG